MFYNAKYSRNEGPNGNLSACETFCLANNSSYYNDVTQRHPNYLSKSIVHVMSQFTAHGTNNAEQMDSFFLGSGVHFSKTLEEPTNSGTQDTVYSGEVITTELQHKATNKHFCKW